MGPWTLRWKSTKEGTKEEQRGRPTRALAPAPSACKRLSRRQVLAVSKPPRHSARTRRTERPVERDRQTHGEQHRTLCSGAPDTSSSAASGTPRERKVPHPAVPEGCRKRAHEQGGIVSQGGAQHVPGGTGESPPEEVRGSRRAGVRIPAQSGQRLRDAPHWCKGSDPWSRAEQGSVVGRGNSDGGEVTKGGGERTPGERSRETGSTHREGEPADGIQCMAAGGEGVLAGKMQGGGSLALRIPVRPAKSDHAPTAIADHCAPDPVLPSDRNAQ